MGKSVTLGDAVSLYYAEGRPFVQPGLPCLSSLPPLAWFSPVPGVSLVDDDASLVHGRRGSPDDRRSSLVVPPDDWPSTLVTLDDSSPPGGSP